MSDYLWDRAGEADPEVERLEELLGGLRHGPRKLELPPVAPRAAHAPARFYGAAALLAAALALAALAGLLLTRRDAQPVTPRAGSHAAADNRNAAGVRPAAAPVAPAMSVAPVASVAGPAGEEDEERAGESGRSQKSSSLSPARAGLKNPRGRIRPPASRAARVEAARAGMHAGPAAAADAASTPERAEAKEQLLYALRLASAQLGEVRRKTLGAGAAAGVEDLKARTK